MYERIERALQLLDIRRPLFVDDDHVGSKLFHAPVLMRPEQLPYQVQILRVIDPREDDWQVAGDSLPP